MSSISELSIRIQEQEAVLENTKYSINPEVIKDVLYRKAYREEYFNSIITQQTNLNVLLEEREDLADQLDTLIELEEIFN